MYSSYSFLTSALHEGKLSAAPCYKPVAVGGWMGPTAHDVAFSTVYFSYNAPAYQVYIFVVIFNVRNPVASATLHYAINKARHSVPVNL
jgi:hypothetical protein